MTALLLAAALHAAPFSASALCEPSGASVSFKLGIWNAGTCTSVVLVFRRANPAGSISQSVRRCPACPGGRLGFTWSVAGLARGWHELDVSEDVTGRFVGNWRWRVP